MNNSPETLDKNQDIVILDVEETQKEIQDDSFLTWVQGFFTARGTINLRKKVIFFRMLATMVNASITVVKSLVALKKQEKDKNMIAFYKFVIQKVQSGGTLNSALRAYYGNFSDAECSIIEAGERTGSLNTALLQLAEQTEKLDSITRKVKGAMTYPVVLFGGMVAVIVVMITKVVPSLLQFFPDQESLPESTKIVIGMSEFIQKFWFLVIISIAGFVIMVLIWKKTSAGKYYFDQFLLRIPIVGGIIKKVILSKFSRVFANLTGSGIAIVESLRIVSSAVGNEVYKQRILLLRQDVRNGMKIATSLEDDPLFPELLLAMLRIGEETAQISTTIIKIADFYDEEVDIVIESIQKLIEPVILVMMGGVVALIAISVFQPLMGMADNIA